MQLLFFFSLQLKSNIKQLNTNKMVPVLRKFCGHCDITWDLFGDPQLGPLPLQGASICPFSQLKNKSKQARKTNKSKLQSTFAGLSLAVTACLWRPPPADAHLHEQTFFGGGAKDFFSPPVLTCVQSSMSFGVYLSHIRIRIIKKWTKSNRATTCSSPELVLSWGSVPKKPTPAQ